MQAARRPVYSAAQARELDRRAVGGRVEVGHALMRRAAAVAWTAVRERRHAIGRIDLVCGSGNNGGDGYELACLAHADGCEVRVWALGEPKPGTEAALAIANWRAVGAVQPYAPGVLDGARLIVDAIYGLGLSRPPEGLAATAIDEANRRGAYVVALDLPSGLHADRGRVLGTAVRADLTVSFVARKLGLYTGDGPQQAGERVFDTLGVDDDGFVARAELLHEDDLRVALPRRPRGAHKGQHGFVLLIGGDRGYTGAILLATRAALRGGAGLVAVATRREHAALLAASQPEAMFRGVETAEELQPLLDQADVVAIGPGLGRQDWGRALWSAALASGKALVVDADALNLLAETPPKDRPRRDDWVLTPHPGEAARLLGGKTADVEQDRGAAVQALADHLGGAVVLKGAGSLIAGRDTLAVCPYGNPGMAVGGMGDTLTGIVAALLGQGLAPVDAARTAVLAHALAGDRAARGGERGLLPGDVIDELRAVMNPGAVGDRG